MEVEKKLAGGNITAVSHIDDTVPSFPQICSMILAGFVQNNLTRKL